MCCASLFQRCGCRARIRMTFGLPWSRMNCAERSQSAIVAAMPRFSSTGRPVCAAASSNVIVFHVARADLQNVGVLGDHRRVLFREDFRHDGQAALCARAREHLQPFQAQPLKCIRRTARLEGAAAKDTRSGAAHMIGRRHQLELRLHRAGPSHGDKLTAADLQIQHRHYGLLAPRALQAIGAFGKSFAPIFTHLARSVLGKS